MKKEQQFVAYYRVSTQRQGVSGLGLEGQEREVMDFVRSRSGVLSGSFTDVESGKSTKRVGLAAALEMVKATGATLVIAKLDRLARNASFTMSLMDAGVDFIACDMPSANRITIVIMAELAQMEREAISKRTSAALQAKKARGFALGNPANFTSEGREKGIESMKAAARENENNRRATSMAIMMREQDATLREICEELNRSGFLTSTGKSFKPTTVMRLLDRANLVCEKA